MAIKNTMDEKVRRVKVRKKTKWLSSSSICKKSFRKIPINKSSTWMRAFNSFQLVIHSYVKKVVKKVFLHSTCMRGKNFLKNYLLSSQFPQDLNRFPNLFPISCS